MNGAHPASALGSSPGLACAMILAALPPLSGCQRTATSPSGAGSLPTSARWSGMSVRLAGERTRPTHAVVLLHGWGASGDDLVPLAEPLAAPGRLFVFPEAPLPGPGFGRAWWPLDVQQLEAARAAGPKRELGETVPAGLVQARAGMVGLLAELAQKTHLPPSAIVLGGFSQGAMLAVDAALAAERSPAAVVALSGTLLAERVWQQAWARLPRPLPTFVSHGRQDQVLPFWLAEALKDRLQDAGQPVTWVPFEGGHEIPAPVVGALRTFLAQTQPPAS